MKNVWIIAVIVLTVGMFSFFTEETQAKKKKKKHAYVGVKKCKMCHKKKKAGNQYGAWKKMKHAKAYETLKSKEAKAVAKKLGLKKAPHKSKKCLKCHVTGYGESKSLVKKIKYKNGIGCESCHGAGKGYKKKSIMKKITKNRKLAGKYGLTLPTPKTCAKCHNSESPTYKGPDPKKDWKGFVKEFKKRYNEKIKHLRPKSKVSKEWQE